MSSCYLWSASMYRAVMEAQRHWPAKNLPLRGVLSRSVSFLNKQHVICVQARSDCK